MDKLDEIPREGTSIMHVRDVSVHAGRSTTLVENAGRSSRREGKRVLLEDVPGASNIKSKAKGAVQRRGKLCESCLLRPERFFIVCVGRL
jgi:hypothetical protein